jgi:hypothetical protein
VTAVRAFGAGERKAHWRTVLGEQLIEVEIAEWIKDFPGTLRRLLSFLDLPYDSCGGSTNRPGGFGPQALIRQLR